MNHLRKYFQLILIVVMLISSAVWSDAAQLHGTAGEVQVVGEMKVRLRKALSKGDLNACRREGDNLARYGKGGDGETLIRQDIEAVQRKLDAINVVYKGFYDLRTLNNKKSVKQAFKLISKIQDKFVDDAATNVAFVFVPAPLTASGLIAGEFLKSAVDVHGSYSDAGEVKDVAQGLQQLDRLVKEYDLKIKKMVPEIRKAQEVRSRLTACEQAFREGAQKSAAAKTPPPVETPKSQCVVTVKLASNMKYAGNVERSAMAMQSRGNYEFVLFGGEQLPVACGDKSEFRAVKKEGTVGNYTIERVFAGRFSPDRSKLEEGIFDETRVSYTDNFTVKIHFKLKDIPVEKRSVANGMLNATYQISRLDESKDELVNIEPYISEASYELLYKDGAKVYSSGFAHNLTSYTPNPNAKANYPQYFYKKMNAIIPNTFIKFESGPNAAVQRK